MRMNAMLNRLARLVPGIGGFQDREGARDRDWDTRQRIARGLDLQKRELEDGVRALTARGDTAPLADLGRVTSRLDHLANAVRSVARSSGGFFDEARPDLDRLERLDEYDLGLLGQVTRLSAVARKVRESAGSDRALRAAIDEIGRGLDELEAALERRTAVTSM